VADRSTPRACAAAIATLRRLLIAGLLFKLLASVAGADEMSDADTGMAPPGSVPGRAGTCAATACLALTISEEAVARWRKGRPTETLPISALTGSFKGDREVAVSLLLASYNNGILVDWTTRRPTVARVGPRGFRADGVRPLVRPGGPAARDLPAFALKHTGDKATVELATPVPSVAAKTSWWLQAAHFRNVLRSAWPRSARAWLTPGRARSERS
jgi:hypothetical protein